MAKSMQMVVAFLFLATILTALAWVLASPRGGMRQLSQAEAVAIKGADPVDPNCTSRYFFCACTDYEDDCPTGQENWECKYCDSQHNHEKLIPHGLLDTYVASWSYSTEWCGREANVSYCVTVGDHLQCVNDNFFGWSTEYCDSDHNVASYPCIQVIAP
jgi:hypothetical protein